MISATAWIPRGYASEFPERYDLNDEEMARIEAMATLNLKDAQEDLEEVEDIKADGLKADIEIDDDLKEYDFEHYDDEEVDEAGEPIVMFPGLSNTDATYITKKVKTNAEGEEEEEEEYEEHFIELPTKEEEAEQEQELQVYPTDNLILATRTEDDVSYLDVYVYDDGAGQLDAEDTETDSYDKDVQKGLVREGNMYIHHDLMLPSFPICVEWLSFKPNGPNDESNVANFAAIGTFEPTIEVWNLDSIDKAFPDVILGEEEYSSWNSSSKKGKKGKKSKKSSSTSPNCHTDAVVSLSHNRVFRNVLCSTSADTTVKLWDLTSCKVARAIDDGLHSGSQVSSSAWMPSNGNTEEGGSVLLTGGYDSTMKLSDVRVEDVIKSAKTYKCGQGEEIESVNWMGDDKILAGCDNGNVYCYDIRKEDKPVWTLHAHDSGITTLASNNFCSGLIGTGAMKDKEMKLWNVKDGKPSLVLRKNFGCGNVLSSGFSNDLEVAGHLVVGGTSPGLKLWDAFSNKTISGAFRDEIKDIQERAKTEAKANNRTSRIARKYKRGYTESLVSPEVGGSETLEEADDDE